MFQGDKKNEAPSQKPDPIVDPLGELGRWQLFVCLTLFVSKFPTGWVLIGHVFLAARMEYKCVDGSDDPCSDKCLKVELDHSIFEETIISEFNLICKSGEFWADFSQAVVVCGVMMGNIVGGMLADKFGRKLAFVAPCVLQLITGCAVSLSPHFAVYCVLRFLTGFMVGCTMVTNIVIIMEIIGKKHRELISILYQIPFNLGHASLPLFSYYLRHWRWFNFSYSAFTVLYIAYIWITPESPRWCLVKGKLEKCIAILERGAKCNGKPTEQIRGNIEAAYAKLQSETTAKKATVFDLFRTPNSCLKTIIMIWNWIAVCVTYYGVSIYISQLGGDIFLNVAISALLGVPGTIICVPLTKYLGRKPTLILSNSLSAVSLLAIACRPQMNEIIKVALATIGLFGASVTFPNVYLYAAELFPTVVRNGGVGLCSMAGRLGAMLAPFISSLSRVELYLPPLLFGLISGTAAISVFFLPETRGHPLPETLEDGEAFGKKHNAGSAGNRNRNPAPL